MQRSHRSTTPGETKLLASEIYELLQTSSNAESEAPEEPVSSRRKAQFFLGSSNKRAKTVVLHIEGLDDPVGGNRVPAFTTPAGLFLRVGVNLSSGSFGAVLQSRRGLCEEALLKIRGVISFTFQMTVRRCIVRIRSDLKAEVRPPSFPSLFRCSNSSSSLPLDAAPQALASAIASTQVMKAQQVVKGENGDEVS